MFSYLPQLNSIKVFESAARLGSFKAAAKELNVTPTAVSHQVRGLEERLGTLLFERRIRSVTLTAEGERLAQVAFWSLQAISSVIDDISARKTTLHVSTTASFAALWLVPKLSRFQQKHPEINIEIKTGENLDLIEKDRRIDLAIRYGLFDSENDDAQRLVTESFNVYGVESYIKTHQNLESATLIETRWQNKSLPPITWKQWLKQFQPGIEVNELRCFDQELHVIQATLAGQGLALLSSVLAQEALEQNWLLPYGTNCSLPGLTYYVLKSPFTKSSRKVSLFLDWLKEEFSAFNSDLDVSA